MRGFLLMMSVVYAAAALRAVARGCLYGGGFVVGQSG